MNRKIILYTFAAALCLAGCEKPNSGSDDGGSDKPATETSKSVAEIQFVSRLTDESLFKTSADFDAVNSYMVNTLQKKEKSSVLYLDRTDMAMSNVAKLCVNSYRWSTFNTCKMTSTGTFTGTAIYVNTPISDFKSYRCGNDGPFVSGQPVEVAGKFIKLDGNGNETSSKEVDQTVYLYTVRLDSQSEIDAFAGSSGPLKQIRDAHSDLLLIGVVKSSLFNGLGTSVQTVDSNFEVNAATEEGSYRLFVLGSKKNWNYWGCTTTNLSSGINAYSVSVGWK